VELWKGTNFHADNNHKRKKGDTNMKVEYSLAAIENALKNWDDIMEAETHAVVEVRADIANAIKKLTAEDKAIIGPVMKHGKAAFDMGDGYGRKLVPFRYWGRVTRRLYQILNVEGTD
jgi:hypothetical protein